MNQDDLNNRFSYHAPSTEDVADTHEDIRQECQNLATFIVLYTPESREQSLAVTKLEEVMYWANAAIARNQ